MNLELQQRDRKHIKNGDREWDGEDGIKVRGSGAQFSLCPVEHLADLLRNRVNDQWNPKFYDVCKKLQWTLKNKW